MLIGIATHNKAHHSLPLVAGTSNDTSPHKVDAYHNDEVGKKWLKYLVTRGL
jgi:hypothetical protein